MIKRAAPHPQGTGRARCNNTLSRQYSRTTGNGKATPWAPPCHAGRVSRGHRRITPQTLSLHHDAPVAQLDRVLPSEGRGHRFESCRARHALDRSRRFLLCLCTASYGVRSPGFPGARPSALTVLVLSLEDLPGVGIANGPIRCDRPRSGSGPLPNPPAITRDRATPPGDGSIVCSCSAASTVPWHCRRRLLSDTRPRQDATSARALPRWDVCGRAPGWGGVRTRWRVVGVCLPAHPA
jgi:hypothetical protein